MIDCMYFGNISKVNDDIIGLEWTSVSSGFDVKKCTVQKSNYASHSKAFNYFRVPNKQSVFKIWDIK